MKCWANATKEDILQEMAPGVTMTNTDMINKLNWTEYLPHIRDMIDMGMSVDRELVDEHVTDLIESIFMSMGRLIYDRPVDPKEVTEYMETEHAQKTREALIQLTMSHTAETWPDMEADIRRKVGMEGE